MIVYITSRASVKLWAYIEAVSTEIGGMGYAFRQGDDLIWDDTFLLPQIVSSSEVDFETTAGDEYAIDKAAKDGVLGQEGFVWVSWHSHHTMKAFWSSTDDKRIAALATTGIPYVLSLVGCHDHEYQCRFDMFEVVHKDIVIPQVTMKDLNVLPDAQDKMLAEVFDDIAANVRKKEYKPITNSGYKRTSLPPVSTKKNDPGDQLERALTIRSLMESGMDRAQAEKYADEMDDDTREFIVGPEGVVEIPASALEDADDDEWDRLAWGELGSFSTVTESD